MKIFGQIEAVEFVLRPNPQAFFKRLAFCISPDKNPCDDSLDITASMGLWQGLHDWMLTGPYIQPCYIHCGGQARSILRIVLRAISDWIDARAASRESACKRFCIKVGFAFSDVLRNSLSMMRQIQFMEQQSIKLTFDANRTAIEPYELVLGLKNYWRELEMHALYYRFMREKCSGIAGGDEKRAAISLADRLEAADHPKGDCQGLSCDDQLQRDIIIAAKGYPNGFSPNDLKSKLRHKLTYVKNTTLLQEITDSAAKFVDEGVLEEVEVDRSTLKGPRRNVKFCSRPSWISIQGKESAKSKCDELRLNNYACPA